METGPSYSVEQVEEIVLDVLKGQGLTLQDNNDTLEGLGADSLKILDISMDLERHFGLEANSLEDCEVLTISITELIKRTHDRLHSLFAA